MLVSERWSAMRELPLALQNDTAVCLVVSRFFANLIRTLPVVQFPPGHEGFKIRLVGGRIQAQRRLTATHAIDRTAA